ncbi:hypothetical protein FDECE_504 [Fusarium decemcellulare]|nr:hypothetical protein FDECE_504 [Fusarium decemcellulare]
MALLSDQVMLNLGVLPGNLRDPDSQSSSERNLERCWVWLEDEYSSHKWGLHQADHKAALNQYVEGTGDWVFRSTPWKEWISRQKRSLWLHGPSGSGKTALAAHLIQHVLLNQGSADNTPSHPPDARLLLVTLAEILALPCFDTVWVMIDGIDQTDNREILLRNLRRFNRYKRFEKIQLFAVSRTYSSIKKAMLAIAEPLSLAGSLAKKDIGLHIRGIIKTQKHFSHWPARFRKEVRKALVKGAKGRLRWADCQLDILARLKTIEEVQEELSNLTETLEDAYVRILSLIRPAQKEAVRHVLRWIHTHNKLLNPSGKEPREEPDEGSLRGSMSSRVLLEAYLNLQQGPGPTGSCPVDLESLKESCGCLVTWETETGVNGSKAEVAKIAHGDVRDLLKSHRIPESLSFFSLQPQDTYKDVLASVFCRANATKVLEIPYITETIIDLDQYCVVTAIAAFKVLESYIEPSLAFEFLSPQSKGYPRLQDKKVTRICRYDGEICCHEVDWASLKADNISIGILLQLMELNTTKLLHACIRSYGRDETLNSTLSLKANREIHCPYIGFMRKESDDKRSFHGTALDYFAIFNYDIRSFEDTFLSLLDYADSSMNMSTVLRFYTARWDHTNDTKEKSIISKLLQLGADPNSKDFRVTPLQIACAQGDTEIIEILLKEGGNANLGGNPSVSEWDETHVLRSFAVLHGLSPLRIVKTASRTAMSRGQRPGLEQLLLQHQAKDHEAPTHHRESFNPDEHQWLEYLSDCGMYMIGENEDPDVINRMNDWDDSADDSPSDDPDAMDEANEPDDSSNAPPPDDPDAIDVTNDSDDALDDSPPHAMDIADDSSSDDSSDDSDEMDEIAVLNAVYAMVNGTHPTHARGD